MVISTNGIMIHHGFIVLINRGSILGWSKLTLQLQKMVSSGEDSCFVVNQQIRKGNKPMKSNGCV